MGENLTGQSTEVHGMDVDGWAEFYGFEAIKDYPYSPADQAHLVGKAEDGSNITVSSRELLESYLNSSIAKEGGEEFTREIAEKGTSLIQGWFIETEPGKYKFDMSKPAS